MSIPNPQMRRRARERAVQFLFGLEFTQYAWDTAIEDFWVNNPVRPSVKEYAEKLIGGVVDNREELDRRIGEAVDNWTPDRVGRIERSVLRVAAYEMLYCPDIPRGVAISEALEVAKRFGSDEAPRFINGVLDKLGRDRAPSPPGAPGTA